ncbi:hypothetical protein BAE44_0002723 [Dichanthelium oligosanthes]|uniref:F-box domain-containing protein n=1 Tax=Dichanthelium oligosanthes TaxID=888268 RepID=A0A1E5WFS7_9POAL|nr:hypothetical protein BAE44_0002723 [Dichanthelium oligosanthes]
MAAAAATNSRTDTDGAIVGLPEELLEVFSRVGNVKDLFQFAVTSRRWLRLFDPEFLHGLYPGQGQGHRARLLGFFARNAKFESSIRSIMKTRVMEHTYVSAPTFLPTPGSQLGPTERALTSFVADDDGTFNCARALAARRGIILMQLVYRRQFHQLCVPDDQCFVGLALVGERPAVTANLRSSACIWCT